MECIDNKENYVKQQFKYRSYPQVHLFDAQGNPVNVKGDIVDRRSIEAHIPYKGK